MPMLRLFFYEGLGVPPFLQLARSLRSSIAVALAIRLPSAVRETRPPPVRRGRRGRHGLLTILSVVRREVRGG
jgi:hypothetical protein